MGGLFLYIYFFLYIFFVKNNQPANGPAAERMDAAGFGGEQPGLARRWRWEAPAAPASGAR